MDRAFARFDVIKEEARFCGRSFHGRLEVLRPFWAWRRREGSEEGLRMSPGRWQLGSVMGSSMRGIAIIGTYVVYFELLDVGCVFRVVLSFSARDQWCCRRSDS